ncbi:unnamed protein product [Paramecium octaurelia]|uniref:Uncharacterized protein n=1 Tax=Paramecium octaurelia TaxID=43137 RepID=A0A8S1W886_PAROT|nr:unnamed protein product [Paramecium octaurelia]
MCQINQQIIKSLIKNICEETFEVLSHIFCELSSHGQKQKSDQAQQQQPCASYLGNVKIKQSQQSVLDLDKHLQDQQAGNL